LKAVKSLFFFFENERERRRREREREREREGRAVKRGAFQKKGEREGQGRGGYKNPPFRDRKKF
jgi:hypothetical protein